MVEVFDEVLDTGERQLHPSDVVAVVEDPPERLDTAGVGPHDRFGVRSIDELTAPFDHRVGEPGRRGVRPEVDARSVAVRHRIPEGSGWGRSTDRSGMMSP